MTDLLADSPPLGRPYCQGCEPNADPTREILDLRRCTIHPESFAGLDDARVTTEAILWGSAEAGGAGNSRWCKTVHEEIPLEQGKPLVDRRRAEK